MNTEKNIYETPAIEELGTVEGLTLATNSGTLIDGNYPAGTPIAGHLS
jgi:hypothetical protein